MRKFFLIPLLSVLCTVMAWGTEIEVSTFDALKTALSSSGTADVVKLANDIAYSGAAVLDIQRSLTLDGQGHKITGFAKTAIKTDGASEKHNTSIAINAGQFGSTAELDVTIKNLSVGNPSTSARYYGIVAFDGVKKLTLDNINIVTGDFGVQQGLCFTGTNSTPVQLSVANSYINTGNTAYAVYILKPVVGTFTNTTIEGWCGLYFKYRMTSVYGAVVGSRGSNVTCDACQFTCTNVHNGASNSFAMFPMEDDGISLALHNCSFNAEQIGNEYQALISVQYRTRANATQPISVVISGDNTHMYNINKDHILDVTDDWKNGGSTGFEPETGLATSLTIEGGTFSINPSTFVIEQGDGSSNAPFIDPAAYEVKTITTQQGDETSTIYRVRKIAPPTSNSINDNVEGEGAGQNDNTVFAITADETVNVPSNSVVANYVEVSNNATLTVPAGKELEITSGMDITGGAKLEVEAGSTVVIGDGGVTSEGVNSIVIEANENGSASFLLKPEVPINTTPNVTIKMTAKQIGKENTLGEDYYYWFRFSAPVADIEAFDKSPVIPTYIYKWDYSKNDWGSISALSDLTPFQGYALTTDAAITDIEYTFKGRLAGNQDMMLNFKNRGFNYFGNSYTGYIDVHALVDQLMENENIDGSIYLWNTTDQQFYPVTLGDISSGAVEIAPMQTFILRQINTGSAVSTELNYASAIWGNPRYGKVPSAPAGAPARYAKADNVNRLNVVITAANGQKDNIILKEAENYSNEFEKGFDAVKFMNERTINLYTTMGEEKYGVVATDNLEGMLLNFQTNNEIAYTMSFENLNGTEYFIRDNVTNRVIAIEEGTTYEFAAQPNSTIEGRFEVVRAPQVLTGIENAEVKANAKGIYSMTGIYMGEDFKALPAGVYVVDGVKIVK